MSTDEKGFKASEYIRSALSILIFFLLLLLFTPIIMLLLIVSFGRLSNFVVEKIAPVIARLVLVVLGVKFHVKKHIDSIPSPAVFIINHSSTLDMLTLLAMGLPRIRFVAKWEFQYNPLFFILGRLTGQVFIKRQHSEKAVSTLQKSVSRLKKKQLSVLMAPEGSRNHPGIIGPFKKGPFRMAMDLQYPIVPVYFEGHRELSSGKYLVTRTGTCTAHIYPPVDTSGWKTETLETHIEEVRRKYLSWAGVTG